MSKVYANVVATRRECVNNVGGSLTSSWSGLSDVRRHVKFGRFGAHSKSLLLKDLEKGADRMKKYFSKLFTHHGVPHQIQINTRSCSHRLTWLRQQVTHLRKCTRLPPSGHFLWCTLHKLIPQGSHRPIDNQNHGTASFSSASNNGHVSAYCTIL